MAQHKCGDLILTLACGIVSSTKIIALIYKMPMPLVDNPSELRHAINTKLDKNGLGQEPLILNHHASGMKPPQIFQLISVLIALKLA